MSLDEIEARANAATPGPWTCKRNHSPYDGFWIEYQAYKRELETIADRVLTQDAAFIAAARTDVPALVARVRELEAECERMKTFAAQNFSAMIRQEAEQMREYGLTYEGVRKVLREHDDGEISFGKLMDLIRAAARAMAEEECTALRREIAQLMDDH